MVVLKVWVLDQQHQYHWKLSGEAIFTTLGRLPRPVEKKLTLQSGVTSSQVILIRLNFEDY